MKSLFEEDFSIVSHSGHIIIRDTSMMADHQGQTLQDEGNLTRRTNYLMSIQFLYVCVVKPNPIDQCPCRRPRSAELTIGGTSTVSNGQSDVWFGQMVWQIDWLITGQSTRRGVPSRAATTVLVQKSTQKKHTQYALGQPL